jgi:hypothetical protein
LEHRLCLSVSAAVSDGDLIVEGDADGAVEIVAVSEGAYRVTDNGVVIADETTLQGVTDDIRSDLETNVAGTNDTVSVDLGGQIVDRVYADLGDGDNSFELINGTASALVYRGGDGIDSVSLTATIESRALVSLGGGDNDLTVAGTVDGRLFVSARDGNDTVTIVDGAAIGRSARIALGGGDNTTTIAGSIDGNLGYNGGDGNDSVALAETAVVADSFFARLGAGDNTVTDAGSIGGDLRVVSKNADDTVDVTDTATIGGTTDLGLGDQQDHSGGCRHGHEHAHELGQEGDHGLATLALNGRALGFYYRGFRR